MHPTTPAGVAPAHFTMLGGPQVVSTIERLQERISARFPNRNLARVARAVADVGAQIEDRRPPTWLRLLRAASNVLIVLLAAAAAIGISSAVLDGMHAGSWAVDWLGIGESAINDIVFAGITILFLWALPHRIQRQRDLRVLYRLRSLAHVVDMHQPHQGPGSVPAGLPPDVGDH